MSKITDIKADIASIEKGIDNTVVSEGMKEGMRKAVADLKSKLAAEEAKQAEKKSKVRKQITIPKVEPKKPEPVVHKPEPKRVIKPAKGPVSKKPVRIKKKVKKQLKPAGVRVLKKLPAHKIKRHKKAAKGFKLPKYVRRFNSGRGGSDIKRDSQRLAKAPGKHKQKPGSKHKFYYEKRANRTDVSTKWKLAGGGGIFGGRSNAALAKDMKYFNKRQKHEVDYAKSAGRKKVKYKKKDFFEVGGGVGSCGCTHNEGRRMQDSEVKYLEYIRKWQVENLPSKYHDMPLEDVPDSAFTKDQLKKRDELLAKLHNEEFAKGGHIIVGYTKTGKRIYADASHPSHQSFSAQEREDAKKYHGNMGMPGLKQYGQRAKGGYAKGGKAHPEKVGKVMREFKAHKLKSHGKVVTSRDQAIAIALSEANMSKKKVQ